MTFQLSNPKVTAKSELYANLADQLRHLIDGEQDFIANAANLSSLVYHSLPDVNWAGVYLYKEGELVLGPFQGKPACVRIALGKGVCGTAAKIRETVIVPNVHQFPGHIACDSESNSEIVVPLLKGGNLIGVFDIDSPSINRFDDQDARGMSELIRVFMNSATRGENDYHSQSQ